MIYLIEQKPGEAMSFAGRFRLTGVAMIDSDDVKTLPLPGVVSAARYGRWMFLNAVAQMRRPRSWGDEWVAGLYADRAAGWLQNLGGLMGVW